MYQNAYWLCVTNVKEIPETNCNVQQQGNGGIKHGLSTLQHVGLAVKKTESDLYILT